MRTHMYAGWWTLGMFVVVQAQAEPPSASGFPPPGEYRIDSESSMTSEAGTVSMKRVQRVDGATGQITVITTSSLPGDAPITTQYKGNGPVTWCVPVATSGAPRTDLAPGVCDTTLLRSDSSGASFNAVCSGTKQEESWHLVDKNTWEHSLVVVPQANAPAQTNSEVDQAMKPVYAELEKAIRTGSPEEAASAREQLKALRAHAPVTGGAPPFVTHVHERWTRVAQTCSTRR